MVQETTTTSWGSRLGSALKGILFGFVLIICSFILIFWNEGHGLHTAQSLQQTKEALITVPNTPIDAKNNGRPVYFNGLATTENILQDTFVGVSEKAISLNRNVQMYQWKEDIQTTTESQTGGSEKETKTYSYKLVWSDDYLDSSQYKEQTGHQNPSDMPIKTKIEYASHVTVGDFNLPHSIIVDIDGSSPVDLSKINLDTLQDKMHKKVQISDQVLFIGEDAAAPKVGDMRIALSVVLPQTISVIAEQNGHTLQPYVPAAGIPVSLVATGEESPQLMIANEMSANSTMTWILRGVSLFLMIIGFALIMNPLVILADVLPFLGSIVSVGTGLMAFVVAIVLWSIAIAIAWFAVRPLFAIGLVVGVLVICFFLIKFKKGK